MSETPRTDHVKNTLSFAKDAVLAHAMQLERELVESQERIKRLKVAVNKMAEAALMEVDFARQADIKLAAAQERIRRLEEAGDALCTTMQRESKYLFGSNFLVSIKIWKKAKEATP